MTSLAESLYAAVTDLPPPQVDLLIRTLRTIGEPTKDSEMVLKGRHAAHGFRSHAGQIVAAWSADEDNTSGTGLALALEALAIAERARAAQQLEVVWTGPAVEIVDCRSTRSVQLALIQKAERSVTLLTFNASDEELLDALNDANRRGVRVNLIPETVGFDHDPMPVFNRLDRRVRIYEWPEGSRDRAGAYIARLHAKVFVADDHKALITSANLSYLAAIKNIEVGVLITGGPLPADLAGQITQLIEVGVLTRVDRPDGGW